MKTLDRYILLQHVPPFLFGLFVILFTLVLNFLYKNLEMLIGKGVPISVSAELLLLSLGWMIVMAIPMAVLIGTLMTFMRLASDNEIVAMKTGGLSLARIARTPLIASIVLSFLLIPVHNYLVPETNHRLANLLASIHRKKPAIQLRDGVFMNRIKGYSILVNKAKGREIEGVTISKLEEGKPAQTIRAERGEIYFDDDGTTLVIKLYNGEIHDVDQNDPKRYLRLRFEEHTLFIPDAGSQLVKLERDYRGEREMSISDLTREVRTYANKVKTKQAQVEKIVRETSQKVKEAYSAALAGDANVAPRTILRAIKDAEEQLRTIKTQISSFKRRIRSRSVEIHKKFAISFACVVFVLVGIPIGARTKDATAGSGMVISIVFFAIYYVFLSSGEKLADRGLLPPWLSMWAANIVLGSVGLYLFLRSNRELPLLPKTIRSILKALGKKN